MSVKLFAENFGNYGRDVRLNLGQVISEEGAPGLSPSQIRGIALSSAYATQCAPLVKAVLSEFAAALTPEETEAAKGAASTMAMNNIYYRFVHLSEDKEFSQMPAKLRMNVMGNPGVPKVDFELYSLAVSALSGCGMCINAHVKQVRKEGITAEGIQSAVRIASVLNAAAQTHFLEEVK